MHRTIVTCALTGSGDTVARNPAVPVSPEQIASSAIDAAKAGAAIVHVHVRDPATGKPSMDLALYTETYDRIRSSGVDVIVNLTTGPGAMYVPDEADPTRGGPGTTITTTERRMEHILRLRPEVCTLDVGTLNFYDVPFVVTPKQIREMAALMRDAGVKPELECFHSGDVRFSKHLIDSGLVVGKPLFNLVLGVPWNAEADTASFSYMVSQLPSGCAWGGFAVSSRSLPMAVQSFLMGGHVRVGLEDALYLEKGKLAPSNAALVERIIKIIGLLGATIATPSEAREILGLGAKQ